MRFVYENDDEILFGAVEELKAGKIQSFDKIYEYSKKYIYKIIHDVIKNDTAVEDLMQDTYLQIYNKINTLENSRLFLIWAGRIATNYALRYLQKNKEIVAADLVSDDGEEFVFETVSDDHEEFIPEDVVMNQEKVRLIGNILDGLSPEQKIAVQFFYYEEMSVRDIAQVCECSEGTIKSRLNYARKAIKEAVVDLEVNKGTKLYSLGAFPIIYIIFRAKSLTVSASAFTGFTTLESTVREICSQVQTVSAVTESVSGMAHESAGSATTGTATTSTATLSSVNTPVTEIIAGGAAKTAVATVGAGIVGKICIAVAVAAATVSVGIGATLKAHTVIDIRDKETHISAEDDRDSDSDMSDLDSTDKDVFEETEHGTPISEETVSEELPLEESKSAESASETTTQDETASEMQSVATELPYEYIGLGSIEYDYYYSVDAMSLTVAVGKIDSCPQYGGENFCGTGLYWSCTAKDENYAGDRTTWDMEKIEKACQSEEEYIRDWDPDADIYVSPYSSDETKSIMMNIYELFENYRYFDYYEATDEDWKYLLDNIPYFVISDENNTYLVVLERFNEEIIDWEALLKVDEQDDTEIYLLTAAQVYRINGDVDQVIEDILN